MDGRTPARAARWIERRLKERGFGTKKRARYLARIHLLFTPFGDGPRVATIASGRIEFKAAKKVRGIPAATFSAFSRKTCGKSESCTTKSSDFV